MGYNILTDKLPATVKINGAEYCINADFRTSIRFEIMMNDKSIPDEVKIQRMLLMYYPEIPPDKNKAVESVMWFYNHEKRNKEEKDDRRTRRRKSAISYSFAQDGTYIYASFMEQYGINLQNIPDDALHWWEFIALFEALSENTQMGKIIYYRTVSTSGMSNAKRRSVNELKKLYALRDDVSCDMKVALAKRNAGWKEYVKKRIGDIDM